MYKCVLFVLLLLATGCGSQTHPALKGWENRAGQDLLIEGRRLSEAGDFETALVFFDAAHQKFTKEDNKFKVGETAAAKSITLRRLGRYDESITDLNAAIELTQGTGGVVLPLFNLGKTQQAQGDAACVETYRQTINAMEKYQPIPFYRPAVVNDMKIHLAVAELLFNKDPGDAEQRVLAAIDELLADESLDQFGRMVWVSGGYLGLAQYYIELDPSKAWSYYDLAEEIILDYPETTTLRRQDLAALREKMPPRP